MEYIRLENRLKQQITSQKSRDMRDRAREFFEDEAIELERRDFFSLAGNNPFIGESKNKVIDLLSDPGVYDLVEEDDRSYFPKSVGIDVSYLPGVTDNVALSAKELLNLNGLDFTLLRFGQYYLFDFSRAKRVYDASLCLDFLKENYYNELIQNAWDVGQKDRFSPDFLEEFLASSLSLLNNRGSGDEKKQAGFEHLDRALFDELDQLFAESERRHLALTENELAYIQAYYQKGEVKQQREKRGLAATPTDVELEVLAQTWSEHCKHKIFAAQIEYREECTDQKQHSRRLCKKEKESLLVNSLYKETIKQTTSDVVKNKDIDWCLSVFKDNAGVVKICDDKLSWAVKVETHNSPSALDAYGGALTGILGVNRDIMGCGLGFKPVANLDVFCLAPPAWPDEHSERALLPKGPMLPERMLEGVHKGVEDGGNQSGIPTVCGAFNFDPCFAGKPLVFCGTLGVAPTQLSEGRVSHGKSILPGHHIVVVGGAVGADGIHGATFSSRELDATSPTSAVQIGDPLMQKRVLDFVIEARDRNLFAGLTDNGAGGLSSSVGEMAETSGGARLDLALCPLKYPGLAPFEIMISESQERMTLAVEKEKLAEIESLAKSRNVPFSVLGEFTDSGNLEVYYGESLVALLDIDFLHNSLPQMQLKATWDESFRYPKQEHWPPPLSQKKREFSNWESELGAQIEKLCTGILSRPNVASKEKWIRRYDHEVQGATVGKPLYSKTTGETSPRDGGVISAEVHGGEQNLGACLSVGLHPRMSRYDTYIMAIYAVDEAIRNLLCQGAGPDRISVLDNFCWPDPVESSRNPHGAFRLAQLVRCCFGLRQSCMTHSLPLISGKDSMKNDFKGHNLNGDPLNISVDPTLLVTALGVCELSSLPRPAFETEGEVLYLIGPNAAQATHLNLCASELEDYFGEQGQQRLFADCGVDLLGYRSQFLSKDWDGLLAATSDIYQRLHRAVKTGQVLALHDVSEGGALTALTEMTFAHGVGVELSLSQSEGLELYQLLFGEGPGHFIVSIKSDKKDEFESSFESESFLELGKTQGHGEIKITTAENKLCSIPIYRARTSWEHYLDQHEREVRS